MRTDGYVKTTVNSGIDSTEWKLSGKYGGIITPYNIKGMNLPDSYDCYQSCAVVNTSGIIHISGSDSRSVWITKLQITSPSEFTDHTAEYLFNFERCTVGVQPPSTEGKVPLDSTSSIASAAVGKGNSNGGTALTTDIIRRAIMSSGGSGTNITNIVLYPIRLISSTEIARLRLTSTSGIVFGAVLTWIEY